MALTRKMLKAMGIEEDKVEQIIEAHTESVDALKKERDGFKADAEKLPDVQKELDDLKAKGDGGFKQKYEDAKKELETYKAEQAQKETNTKKKAAYMGVLEEASIDEKRREDILGIKNLDEIELDENGEIKDKATMVEGVKKKFSAFVVTTRKKGVEVPPGGGDPETEPTSLAAALHQKYDKEG